MSSSSSSFTLAAAPGTDVWKKHPSWDVYNVPTHKTPIRPLSSFTGASLTFDATWTEQYDQAGLLFTLRPRDPANETPRKWIKTGLEYYNGTAQLSTVACDRFADWSITPLAAVGSAAAPVSLRVERDVSEHGVSIWIYYLPPGDGAEKVALREVCWFYAEEAGEWDLEVSAFAARPSETTEDHLSVEFSGLDVSWA